MDNGISHSGNGLAGACTQAIRADRTGIGDIMFTSDDKELVAKHWELLRTIVGNFIPQQNIRGGEII